MHPNLLTLACLALIACGDDTTTSSDSSATGTDDSATPANDDTGTTGSGGNLDQDHDGFKASEDCDDLDAQTWPGADELCDESDNDCDDLIDEGFDGDSDGYLSEALCEHGDDCDDESVLVNPGATEVPYDGIDQDCDTLDLTDVDGDGFDATEAGGSDCDDDDAALNPDAEDIPKDDIDQDCSGADSLDSDGDGFDDRDFGGDDCDDTDPTVHPDAIDWADDDVNTDCSASTAGRHSLDTWGTTVVGTPGGQDLLGYYTALCDLDEDGLSDVIISAPFGGNYTGQVGIFLGASWSTWAKDMAMTDADTVIDGGGGTEFFGAGVSCADIDGDGHLDLAIGNSEVDIPDYGMDEDYGVYLFYGDGYAFPTKVSRDEADAAFTVDMAPVDTTATTVFLNELRTADLDGNGASELVLFVGSSEVSLWDGEVKLLVVEGSRYSGSSDLLDAAIAELTMDDIGLISSLRTLPDLDGDGNQEFALTQAEWQVGDTGDTGGGAAVVDTGDPGDTGGTPWDYAEYLPWEGRLELLDGVPTGTSDFAEHVALTGSGTPASFFGLDAAAGDFDGDGTQDLAVGSLGDPSWSLALPGAVHLFSDIATDAATGSFDLDTDADGAIVGEEDYGYLGYQLVNAGDADGDGTEDLWVLEANGGSSDQGWLYLLGGEYLSLDAALGDATMLDFYNGNAADALGFGLASGGDIDGDGMPDAIIGAPAYSTASYEEGRVFILLSGDW